MYPFNKHRAANNEKHANDSAIINKENKEITITDEMIQHAINQLENYHFYPSNKTIQNNEFKKIPATPKLTLVR
ncbi:MAG: hypothetical protein KUG80_08770 [Gammaproteobacteria bacterium]|nr:hypothetical protein [Gammaproteobacteria bacterium]